MLVPIGGSLKDGSGFIDGGVIGQILGGQIGFISSVLLHIALTLPFIHTHLHPAIDLTVKNSIHTKSKNIVTSFFIPPNSTPAVKPCTQMHVQSLTHVKFSLHPFPV